MPAELAHYDNEYDLTCRTCEPHVLLGQRLNSTETIKTRDAHHKEFHSGVSKNYGHPATGVYLVSCEECNWNTEPMREDSATMNRDAHNRIFHPDHQPPDP